MKHTILFLFLLIPALVFSQSRRIGPSEFSEMQGIQLVQVTDQGNTGQAAGYWNKGDFISFAFAPSGAGTYLFRFRTGTNINGARYSLRDETGKILAELLPVNTGSHGVFTDLVVELKMPARQQVLKYVLESDNSGADLHWVEYRLLREAGAPLIKMDSLILLTGVKKGQKGTVQLNPEVRDEDGKLVAYQWEKLSGQGGFVKTSGKSQAVIEDLVHGEYVFRFTAKDNDNKTASQDVRIIVKECAGGRKHVIHPPGGSGTGLYIEAADYAVRKNKYPTYNYPKPDIRPGDTVALSSSHVWDFFEMFGFDGAPGCPIVITSDGGTVKINRRIILTDCNYIKIDGRFPGDTTSTVDEWGTQRYRIRIGESEIRDIAVGIQGRSSNIEIDKIRAENIWYGVMAKTDPPQDPHCDSMYNYPNWIMDNIHIHHSFFKNTLQDVLYLGNTDPFGERTYKCNGRQVKFIPMRIANFNVHHNRIWIANRSGIMLSGAETGSNRIHHNHISDMGYEFNQHQGTGISLGGMTANTHVYNNRIRNTFLYGIFDLGTGVNYIYNNFIDSSGYLNMRAFADRPNMKVDSLARAINLVARGNFILNDHQGGIANIQSTTKGTRPGLKKTVIIRNNILGANTSAYAPAGNISFAQWGPPADWSRDNIVCGNRRKDRNTPVEIFQFNWNAKNPKWPVYKEDCNTPLDRISLKQEDVPENENRVAGTYILIGAASVVAVSMIIWMMRK